MNGKLFRRICMFEYFALFALTRFAYYHYAPIVELFPDSFQYSEIAFQLDLKMFPSFGNILPIYPLFLFVVKLTSADIVSIAVAQTLMSFFSGAFLVFSVIKISKFSSKIIVIVFIFMLASFQGSNSYLSHETSVLTESLYVSFLMIASACIIQYGCTERPLYLILFSFAAGLILLLRLNGFSLVIIILGISIYLLQTRKYLRLIYLLLPLILLISGFIMYNLWSHGSLLPFRYKIYYKNDYYTSAEFYRDLRVVTPNYITPISESEFIDAQLVGVAKILEEKKPSFYQKLYAYFTWHDKKMFYGDIFEERVNSYSRTPYKDIVEPIFINIGFAPPALLEYTYMNYWDAKPTLIIINSGNVGDVSIKYSIPIIASQLIERTYKVLFNISAFAILNLAFVIFLLLPKFRNNLPRNKLLVFLVLFATLFLEALITSYGAFRIIPRYVYPTGFLFFLCPTIFLSFIGVNENQGGA